MRLPTLPLLAAFAAIVLPLHAAEPVSLMPANEAELKVEGAKATLVGDGDSRVLEITFEPFERYRNVVINGPGGGWNLSGAEAVEATIRNTGDERLRVGMRVDGDLPAQEKPWNQSGGVIEPGETGTIRVTFGESYGKPSFELDASAVASARLFLTKGDDTRTIVVESIKSVPAE